jgi:tRNA (guanine-N7-)-methyltransferase
VTLHREINPYRTLVTSMGRKILVNGTTDVSDETGDLVRSALSPFLKRYCEIGSGSGIHLVTRAQRDRAGAYIGIELRYKRAYRTAEKAERAGLDNLFVLRTDARHLPRLFRDTPLHGIYINFPDPWDKRRWHKNRILGPSLLDQASTLLEPGGFIAYKTDHQEYFESSLSLFEADPRYQVAEFSRDLYGSTHLEENVPTEFERLFLSQGLPIYFLRARLLGT